MLFYLILLAKVRCFGIQHIYVKHNTRRTCFKKFTGNKLTSRVPTRTVKNGNAFSSNGKSDKNFGKLKEFETVAEASLCGNVL